MYHFEINVFISSNVILAMFYVNLIFLKTIFRIFEISTVSLVYEIEQHNFTCG